MKKRTIRIFCLLLAAVCLVSGCGLKQVSKESAGQEKNGAAGGKAEQAENAAMGRYAERNLEVSGFDAEGGEKVLRLLENGKGEKILFTYIPDSKQYYSYRMTEEEGFEKTDADWLNEFAKKEGENIFELEASKNGCLYGWYFGKEYKPGIIKTEDGQSFEKVNIPELESTENFVNGFKVTDTGDILISYSEHGCVLYDANDGSEKLRFIQGGVPMDNVRNYMDVKGSRLVTVNPDLNAFWVYDITTGEQIEELGFEMKMSEQGLIKIGNNNDYFYMNEKGLHHLQSGGSIIETIIDGSLNSMGMPGIVMNSLLLGEADYYTLFTDDGELQLAHYVYDANMASVPGTELTLFGLNESKAVSRAVSKFQKDHPDVRVVFTTAEGAGGAVTDEDSIRALNTEILGGKGADILILDGLPVDSYIEKGVLSDISDIIAPMLSAGELLENVAKGYETSDGKIYGIPVRFGIPICYGEEKAVNALKAMDSLQSFMKENPEISVLARPSFRTFSYRELALLLMDVNFKTLFGAGGAVSKAGLMQYLDTVKQLGEAAGATPAVSALPPVTDAEIKDWLSYREEGSGFLLGDYPFREDAAFYELKGITDMMFPLALKSEHGKVITSVNQIFVPYYIMGVNQASPKQELARQFISSVLSAEEQKKDLSDGFPVNAKALDLWCEKQEGYSIGTSGEMYGGETYKISANYPSKEQIKEILGLGEALTVPLDIDQRVRNAVLEESEAFFEGKASLEKAVDAILNKVNRYLSE